MTEGRGQRTEDRGQRTAGALRIIMAAAALLVCSGCAGMRVRFEAEKYDLIDQGTVTLGVETTLYEGARK